jgi:cell wall assembly regulator SMI1
MLEKSMQEIWAQIDTWLETNAPEIFALLQPGASDEEISKLEDLLSIQFPEDVRSSYRIHNGQSIYEHGLIADDWELLSLERIEEEWKIWKQLLDDGVFQDEKGQDQGSEAALGISNVWWSSKWIPLTYNGGGDHHCLDLDPAKGGTIGQIITMWHDDPTREIVSTSFRDWFEQYAQRLESGELIFSDEYGIVNANDL